MNLCFKYCKGFFGLTFVYNSLSFLNWLSIDTVVVWIHYAFLRDRWLPPQQSIQCRLQTTKKIKSKKCFFYIFWSEPTVSGKRLADSLSSAVELHEPWKTSEFSRTSRIKSNKNTDSTTYKHEYIKSWLIKKLTPWSILHFSLRSNLKQFRQAHCQIPYWWNHIECCKLLAQYHAGSKGCVLIHSFTFLLLFLWLLATKYTKYIGEKQKT